MWYIKGAYLCMIAKKLMIFQKQNAHLLAPSSSKLELMTSHCKPLQPNTPPSHLHPKNPAAKP